MANTPRHIAIIPDGNRRWAKKRGITLVEGYDKGIRKIGDVLKWCKEADVHTLSMWGFSTDNAKRNPEEIKQLFELFKKYLQEILEEERKKGAKEKGKYDVQVRFLGRRSVFPQEIRQAMARIEGATRNNKTYRLNLLLGYGGREEIVDAVNAIIREGVKEVDEETISKHLYTAGIGDPDLVIRTSGEQRLSGLMPWQTTYSEFHFSKKLWPDFSKKDFMEALKTYEKRMRRFGK
ncbi:Tritrans,polycis-undecaprenyl-diphosphate synthase (GGDP specific) [uncultured archaeon]|nr:Tritrans,polycis-undecaprenyl-diphosphate synthase (GGDP specific) [uncultured archaeon]